MVVAAGGVPVLIDPGRPTYTAQTFGPRRYEIWTMRGDWHNVPLVRFLGGHLVHIGVPDGVPADLTPRDLTDPMLYDVWGERITRLDLTVAAPAGTLTVRITEAS